MKHVASYRCKLQVCFYNLDFLFLLIMSAVSDTTNMSSVSEFMAHVSSLLASVTAAALLTLEFLCDAQ